MKTSRQDLLSPSIAKRHLFGIMKTLDALVEELNTLEGRLPVPSRDSYSRMIAGAAPLTLDAVVLGVLQSVRKSLSHATMIISDNRHHTPGSLPTTPLSQINRDVLEGLRDLVHKKTTSPGPL